MQTGTSHQLFPKQLMSNYPDGALNIGLCLNRVPMFKNIQIRSLLFLDQITTCFFIKQLNFFESSILAKNLEWLKNNWQKNFKK